MPRDLQVNLVLTWAELDAQFRRLVPGLWQRHKIHYQWGIIDERIELEGPDTPDSARFTELAAIAGRKLLTLAPTSLHPEVLRAPTDITRWFNALRFEQNELHSAANEVFIPGPKGYLRGHDHNGYVDNPAGASATLALKMSQLPAASLFRRLKRRWHYMKTAPAIISAIVIFLGGLVTVLSQAPAPYLRAQN
jgi:hypothetical protein